MFRKTKLRKLRKLMTRMLAIAVALGLVLQPQFGMSALSYADTSGGGSGSGPGGGSGGSLITEEPVLVVTGDGALGTDPSKDDLTSAIIYEKSYTIEELETMQDGTYYLYSSLNSVGTKRIYKARGVLLSDLLDNTAFTDDKYDDYTVKVIDRVGNYSVLFDPDFDDYTTGGALAGATAHTQSFGAERSYYNSFEGEGENGAVDAPTLLALESIYNDTPLGAIKIPEDADVKDDSTKPRLIIGQLSQEDMNNPAFVQNSQKVLVGDELPAVFTLGDKDYTRAELLLMGRYEAEYKYSSKSGEKTVYARGVPLMDLLADYDDDSTVEFLSADGYENDPVTMADIRDSANEYILAYENDAATGDKTLAGIYDTDKGGKGIHGYFTVYANGKSPIGLVNEIKVTEYTGDDYTNSPYKHITNGGTASPSSPPAGPYNLDAITSATLTVEGPGVKTTVPISVRDMENTSNKNIHNGVYSDSRGSGSVDFSYEGVRLLSILDGSVNSNVQRLDDNVEVVFKNRWRQEIGRLTYAEIKNAVTPIILAYGTAGPNKNDPAPRPFVFTNAAGEDTNLGNGDGPIKLVYDQNEFHEFSQANPKFASVAYLYVEEGGGAPGFKHTQATNEAYNNKVNTEYMITFTGDKMGREVNYTVKELEAMVKYDADNRPTEGGIGHRDEYGLSNTTYWYVNEYEGIKLWDLLTDIGVDTAQGENDDATLVSFSSWDNYIINTKFSLKQLANPDLFYFYEKSPLDIGTDRPTKAQLATEAYQPTNSTDITDRDDNGYPVKKGYPVLLAYGVNGYPYVRDTNVDGYKSGLGNDGGPIRLIYGKTDDLNRSNPDALENYAYFYNNGSQQLQRMQEVYVGEPVRYSTHMQNPEQAYKNMKDEPSALTVEINSGGTTQTNSYTLEQLESILYGEGITKRIRDEEGRQEKGYYFHKKAGSGSNVEDLFEGVSLEYLLTAHIGMQGTLGSVKLYSGTEADPSATYDLSTIGDKGKNSLRSTDGLGMMVAFAKNGYPLVGGSGETPGYVGTDQVTNKTIKNSGGPLIFVRGQTEAEATNGTIVSDSDTSSDTKTSVENLTKIVVDLDPDVFAHVGEDYTAYANQKIQFSGATALGSGVELTVGELETKQKYMVTSSYAISGTAKTYRGLDLYKLLNDKSIGASALMNEITVKGSDGNSKNLTVDDLTNSEKKVILAYGVAKSGDITDGKPLVPSNSSEGYDAEYENTGGPLRLIIDGGTDADCISDVREIEISAATLDGWKHTSGNFLPYATNTLEISGQNLKYNKTFTVADIEAMDNIIVSDSYQMGGNVYIQGVELYKLLQNIGFAGDLDTSAFTADSKDNYPISFSGTQLKEGINGKPILVAFGQGTSATNGLPLVPETTSPGYDNVIGNAYGPLRLVVNDNSGWCVKYLAKIVVGAAGGNPEPTEEKDFNVYGLKSGMVGYDIKAIKNLPNNMGAKTATYTYTNKGTKYTETVKGAYLGDILESLNVNATATVTINTTDNYEAKQESYRDIPISEIKKQEYFVAYDVDSKKVEDADKGSPPIVSTVRIYRNYNDGSSDVLNRLTNIKGVTVTGYDFTAYLTGQNGFPAGGSVRSMSFDDAGGMWVGTYGGGIAYLPDGGDTFSVYKTSGGTGPDLQTDVASAVAADKNGGIWFSQNASYTNPGDNRGVGYLKDGSITWYRASDAPSTIPNDYVQAIEIDNDGNVWFGSFGGLTKYTVSNGTWKTWTKSDGLPAASVNTIAFDGAGGVWIGCYPDGAGTENDLFKGGYAHLSSAGTIDFKKEYTAEYSQTANSSLLADAWVRGMATDNNGGIWVVRSGSYANMQNVGGRVDYVDKNRNITSYTGKELLGANLTITAESNPEIRTVAVDKNGGVWFGTSGDGLFHCTEPGKVNAVYNAANNAWPSVTPIDNIYYLKFVGDTLYVGGAGGVAYADVTLAPPPSTVTVLDPPFTIKQSGKSDIEWKIGGSGNNIKSYGGMEKTYSYNGEERKVVGAPLYSILSASGISMGEVCVTINTTDGFSRDNYLNIPLHEIMSKEYFLAYDIYNGSGAKDKVADVDKNGVQASLRIYRNFDSGASGEKNNEIKGISGVTISTTNSNHVGDATAANAAFKITGAVKKPGYFSSNGLKAYPGIPVYTKKYGWLNTVGSKGNFAITGIYLEDLLKNVMSMSDNAVSITLTASDGKTSIIQLNGEPPVGTGLPGAYWTDGNGNKLMLAWELDGKPLETKNQPLQLVFGQLDENHVNRSGWISGIVSITVNQSGLSKLSSNAGTFTPAFNINNGAYVLTVPATASSITLTLESFSPDAENKINGTVITGSSETIDLTGLNGANNTTKVAITTSYAGILKGYTIDVYKKGEPITTTDTAINDSAATDAAVVADVKTGGTVIKTEATQGDTSATLPLVSVSLVDEQSKEISSVYIPKGVSVSAIASGTESWDGNIMMPTVIPNDSVDIPSGSAVQVIKVGSNVKLEFNQPIRLSFAGMAGKKIAFRSPGTTAAIVIDFEMEYDGADALLANNQGYFDNGKDLIVWTKHMTEFIVFEPIADSGDPDNPGNSGGSGNQTYDLAVTGEVNAAAGFNISTLKQMSGIVTYDYDWLNSVNSTGTTKFTGIALSDLLGHVSLKSSAKSVTIIAADYERSFNLDSKALGVYSKDKDGQPMILAWRQGNSNINLRFVVGQTDTKHVNQPLWVSNVIEIKVNNYTVTPGEGTAGKYEGSGNADGKEEATVIDMTEMTDIKTENGQRVYYLNDKAKELFANNDKDLSLNMDIGKDTNLGIAAPWSVLKEALAYKNDVLLNITGDNMALSINLKDACGGIPEGNDLRIEQSASDKGDEFDKAVRSWQERVSDLYDIRLYFASKDKKDEIAALGKYIKLTIPVTGSDAKNSLIGMVQYNDGMVPVPTFFSKSDGKEYATMYSYRMGAFGLAKGLMSFSDIEKHWAQKNVEAMAAKGLVSGRSADQFKPNGDITRAEFVTIINNAMSYPKDKAKSQRDVDENAWYSSDIATAVTRELLTGDASGIRPNDMITRAEIATILRKVATQNEKLTDSGQSTDLAKFADVSNIPAWAKENIAWAAKNQIINGDGKGNINAGNRATRAEALTMIINMMEKMEMFSKE